MRFLKNNFHWHSESEVAWPVGRPRGAPHSAVSGLLTSAEPALTGALVTAHTDTLPGEMYAGTAGRGRLLSPRRTEGLERERVRGQETVLPIREPGTDGSWGLGVNYLSHKSILCLLTSSSEAHCVICLCVIVPERAGKVSEAFHLSACVCVCVNTLICVFLLKGVNVTSCAEQMFPTACPCRPDSGAVQVFGCR